MEDASTKPKYFADYLRYPVENVFVSIEQINFNLLCVRLEKITDDVKNGEEQKSKKWHTRYSQVWH